MASLPGAKFREARERLNLTYRDVEEASFVLADAKANQEFHVNISRLAEIENRNAVPTIYRIYSLCVIYRVPFAEALQWYGVDLQAFQHDSAMFSLDSTHLLPEPAGGEDVQLPIRLDPGVNLRETTYLSRMIQDWGTVPLALLRGLDLRKYRYGHIGLDDWMMYPLITPGALVQIDTERRKIEDQGWRNDFERPVYFVETRKAYICSWIMPLESGQFLMQPYSLSPCKAVIKAVPDEAEIVGQVTGVAMRLTGAPAGKGQPAADSR